jgi:phosphoribosylformylglycinamidine cyclo-ligase
MTDAVKVPGGHGLHTTDIGDLLLSPTRTYAPLLKRLLTEQFEHIHGLVHCSGGGQTKCMKYLPGSFRIVKDHLFDAPVIFELIQQASGSDDREMYQVFNMGHRLEVFAAPESADALIKAGQELGIGAQVVGRVEAASSKRLELTVGDNIIEY